MTAAAHPLGPLEPLAAYDQFLPVKLVWDAAKGKHNKLPVDHRTGRVTTSGSGGAHDSAIWLNYERACRVVASLGPGHGIGFVLTAAAGIWVIDIDDCREGDDWTPLAKTLCAMLAGTAIEASQSGKGLHCWGRGPIPPHACKNTSLRLECYSDARFVLLGHAADAIGVMAESCPGIAGVVDFYFPPKSAASVDVPDDGPCAEWSGPEDDDALIAMAMRSRSADAAFNGSATFADLWQGNEAALAHSYHADPSSSEPYDRSSADAALAMHLAYWTGRHVARIERLMRRSALVRDKWDRDDYLVKRTIKGACAKVSKVLQAEAPKPTAEGVLVQLRKMNPDEMRATWVDLALPLSEADTTAIVDHLENWGISGRRALLATIKAARRTRDRERLEHRLAERAGSRTQIQWRPESSTDIATEIEQLIVARACPGEYVQFAGVLSHVATVQMPNTCAADRPEDRPPPVPQVEPLDSVAVRKRVEDVVALYDMTRDDGKKFIGVPDRVVETLIGKSTHAAPVINGLLSHPVVLPSGEVLSSIGLHQPSGLYLAGASIADARPYTQHEAAAALTRVRQAFLDGFEFASALDADVALAGLFTGIQRRVLDKAPGLACIASMQSSGKTALAQRVHVILTGHDMPVSTFPLGDEAEVSKRLLSTLLRSPAMVCFDNVPDGFTFRSGTLAAAMTSPTLTQRVLGISRDADAPTNTLFVITGNNLSLGNDEVTRWLVTRLAPKTSRPEERKFSTNDLVGYALRSRPAVLRDVVGTISGFVVHGAKLDLPGSRFAMWDRLVRQPLVWAGAQDPARVFRVNAETSDSVRSHSVLVHALRSIFGDAWFTAADVVQRACDAAMKEAGNALRYALDQHPIKDPRSTKSIGNLLTGKAGRVAEVDGIELMIMGDEPNAKRAKSYRVVTVG